jgi:lipoprotein NlpI
LAKIGRFEDSLAEYQRAAQVEPARGYNFAARAYVYLFRGEPLDALPDIEHGLVLEPDYADALTWRGDVHMAALQIDDAAQDYSEFIARRPGSAEGFDGRGFARMLKADFTGAVEDFRKALELDVFRADTMLWLHWCNARLGKDDHDELAKYARRVDPKAWPGPGLRFALGQASMEEMIKGAKDPAEMQTRDQEALAYFCAGEYYLSIHDAGNAEKMFREALARNVRDRFADFGARSELALLNK